MSRRRTIGEYVVSFPHIDFSSTKKYSSAFRDILIYDEDRHGFKKISIMEGLKHCMRFDPRSGELDFHDFDRGPDMFMKTDPRNKQNTPMEYLGEMTPANLPDQAVRDWTMSVVAGLENEVETARDIQVMRRLVETLEAAPENSAATIGYFKYVHAAYTCGTGVGGVNSGGAKLFNLTTGMLALPVMGGAMMTTASQLIKGRASTEDTDAFKDMFSLTGEAQFIPYGYGSHVGIAELANPKYKKTYPKLHLEAEQAMRGFTSLVQRLEGVCYDNLFMRSRAAPFFYKQKNVSAAVFANLIHERVPPIVVTAHLQPMLEPFDFSTHGPETYGVDGEMDYDISRLKQGESDTEDLRELYKVTLNPAVWDPNLVVGEGDNDEEKEANRKTKVQHTNTVTNAAVDRVMSASMLLTNVFRLSLFQHIKTFIRIAQKKMKSGEDMSAIWEKLYEFIMQKMPAYDKFHLSRALGHLPSSPDDVDTRCHTDLDHFILRLERIKRKGPETFGPLLTHNNRSQQQSVITQLTCSAALSGYLKSYHAVTGDSTDETISNFSSYDDFEKGPDGLANIVDPNQPSGAPGSSMGMIGAGEMQGEMLGFWGNKADDPNASDAANRQNRFGIKRKMGGGADVSFATKDTWNPQWLDGKLQDRIDGCKSIFTNSLHRAVSMALLGCPITYHALSHFIQSNVVFPFNMIYSRPYMTYDMSTGVCMKVGPSTGETLIGHADF